MTTRIDAHQHFWDPAAFDYPWMADASLDPVRRPFTPEDLSPALKRNSIDATVLVQTVSELAETEKFLATAASTSWVRGVVGWVDLVDPAVGATLDRLIDSAPGTLVGVRHQVHDEPDPRWLLREDVQRGLEEVARRGLSYDLLVRTRELPAAIETVRQQPELRFVLDHIAKPPIASGGHEPWSTLVADLGSNQNVDVKLSGMVTEAQWDQWSAATLHPYVSHVLEVFGPERAMFGSDWPVCLLAADYDAVVGALESSLTGLSPAEHEAVFGGTAVRAYALARTADSAASARARSPRRSPVATASPSSGEPTPTASAPAAR